MMGIQKQRRLARSLDPLAINIGMRTRYLKDFDILETALFEQLGYCLSAPPDLAGIKAIKAHTRDANQILQITQMVFEMGLKLFENDWKLSHGLQKLP